jgi:DNA-binding MltR family transcriptional regulator
MLENSEILKKEFKGSSDRAAAIVGTSYLDEILATMIKAYIVDDKPNKDKELFEGNGPLSTFSSRIDISFRFGLISRDEQSLLHLIRKIRNDFAHKLSEASFDNSTIRSRVISASIPKESLFPIQQIESDDGKIISTPVTKADPKETRNTFQETIEHLVTLLQGRIAQCVPLKINEKETFCDSIEPYREMLKSFKFRMSEYISTLECDDVKNKYNERKELIIKSQELIIKAAESI